MATAIMDLRVQADLETLLCGAGDAPVLVFKHSTTCPISARAHGQLLAADAAGELDGVRVACVRVMEERPLSAAIAARFGVAHQSPQALVIRGGRAVWRASHHALTRQVLHAAVAER